MLKNVSDEPVELKWGGEVIVLLPGQRCKYKDPHVELRQKAKHGAALEHIPEVKSAQESKSHLAALPESGEAAEKTESDPPEGSPIEAGTKDQPASTPSGLNCNVCAFEAKSPAGLDAHIRARHAI